MTPPPSTTSSAEPFASRPLSPAPTAIESFWGSILASDRRYPAFLLAGVTAVKLLFIATTKISNCEAYYYVWSRFPSLSYYDHPPMVAWMSWITTLFGFGDFGVRIGPVICSTIFGWLVYLLAERLFSHRVGFYSLAIVSAMPGFLFVGFVLCPEAPMAPLWMGGLLAIEGMRDHDEPWRPLLTGFLVGATFLAKYTGLLLILVIFSYALISPSYRRWLRRPSFYLAGLVALAVASPVIYWNVARGWPSLHLHFVERSAPFEWSAFLSNALHVMYVQWGAYQPLVFPALIVAGVIAARRARIEERYRFLVAASFPVLGLMLGAMFWVKDSESHWTMVGYVPLAIAAGAWLERLVSRPVSTALRWYLRSAAGLTAAAAVFIYAYTLSPSLLRFLPDKMYDADTNFIGELWGWDQLESTVGEVAATLGKNTVVASSHFTLCAHLLAQMDDSPQVYCPSPRTSEFDFLDRRTPPPGANVIFVNNDRYGDSPAALMPERDCSLVSSLSIERTRVLQHYRIYVCSPARLAQE